MVIRYMGTKRHMAGHVRSVLEDLKPNGRVVDLFSGMGSVAESLQDLYPVVTNDVLAFTAAIARARFTGPPRVATVESVLSRLRPAYQTQIEILTTLLAKQLEDEEAALRHGREALATYMSHARHVGNDGFTAKTARLVASDTSNRRYCLACLYFSAGYFSLRQAIEIDALRWAIDSASQPHEMDWLLGAWLVGLAALVNAPGHTAQFLKPNSEAGYARIARTWRRSVWSQFESALWSLRQVGSDAWRSQNEIFISDALDLVGSRCLADVGAFYADPPYTKDQYSRYYHVYETLYHYDFPDSLGAGRCRSDRFATGFSLKSMVVASFHDLCRHIARRHVPLVLSYPSEGLLHQAGWALRDIASSYFTKINVVEVKACHSTMGASKGGAQKPTTEYLYVCRP